MPHRLSLLCHARLSDAASAQFPGDQESSTALQIPVAVCTFVQRSGPWQQCLHGPENRTRQTAHALGLTVPWQVEPQLRDQDYGSWTGRRLTDVAATDSESLRRWLTDPGFSPPNGESFAELSRRVAEWLASLADESARWLVVTHPSVLRAVLLHVLAAPATSMDRISIEPLSLLSLTHHQNRWSFRSLEQA